MCDVHRIALPDLFKNQEPFVFPSDRQSFVSHLQDVCFEHAQRMSVLVSHILQHGVKHFADSILPSFVYNSNRIMLYYIARILDVSKADTGTVIARTVELVQYNNRALREMALIYPLAESLCITSERWLETVRDSLARGHSADYIAPQDPSENEARRIVGAPPPMEGTPRQRNTTVSLVPPVEEILSATSPSTLRTATTRYPFPAPASDELASPVKSGHCMNTHTDHQIETMYSSPNAPTAFEQPMFNLDDLQNFFGWEASDDENAQTTGFEGFGPLGWANNFSIM